MIALNKLTLINPDDQVDIVSNMPFDESIEFYNSDYISSESIEETDLNLSDSTEINKFSPISPSKQETDVNLFPPIPPSIEEEKNDTINLGNGKMDYIKNNNDKTMMTNAWQAITQTENWDFVTQDIDSFMMSSDPRIYLILNKMEELGYDGHSGCSFGLTMRYMQFLAKKGEEEYKKLFEKAKMD